MVTLERRSHCKEILRGHLYLMSFTLHVDRNLVRAHFLAERDGHPNHAFEADRRRIDAAAIAHASVCRGWTFAKRLDESASNARR
ncbi:MAG TPA: hypothetical protein VFG91_03680 [Woeseiaceae bacterium]|nr:hypothetical protein [Woeseiaceae bacterium]